MRLLLGAHVSIAGGVSCAVERAAAHDMTAFQVFVRPNRTWRAPALADEEADRYETRLRASGIRHVVAHSMYLANPASPDRAHRARSERVLVDEIRRCGRLGIRWLVLHPGSHAGTSTAAGLCRAAGVLRRVLDATTGVRTGLCLENTAGQGDSLGSAFEELAALLEALPDRDRTGICLDTAHAHAAGYELATETGWRAARAALGRTVGLRRVRAVHVNDSRTAAGSRVDRHAGIGEGTIGLEAFRRLVRDPTLGRLPLLLETPKRGPDGEDLDARNLARLRRLRGTSGS